MPLPKIDLPLYEIKLFATGKTVKYRPFTVKEEKLLLVAQEAKDPVQAILAVKQVVNNCVEGIDVDELAMFDLEYLLLNLRAKSVNNKVEFYITDPDTSEQVKLSFNIDDVKLTTDEKHTNRIPINEKFTLFLKYPTIDQFITILQHNDDPLLNYQIMLSCLDKLASEDEVYKFADFPQEEIEDFLNDLQGEAVANIELFFNTIPKLRHEIKYTNKSGKEQTFVIEGMQSFFI